MNKRDDEIKELIKLTNELIKSKFGEDNDIQISCSVRNNYEDDDEDDNEDGYYDIEEAIYTEKVRTAKRMLKMNKSISEISAVTELSPKKIRKIKNS